MILQLAALTYALGPVLVFGGLIAFGFIVMYGYAFIAVGHYIIVRITRGKEAATDAFERRFL